MSCILRAERAHVSWVKVQCALGQSAHVPWVKGSSGTSARFGPKLTSRLGYNVGHYEHVGS